MPKLTRIKAKIIESGWTLSKVNQELNSRGFDGSLSNLSQKLSNGTLKYVEAEAIADIIGCKIEWLKQKEGP